MNIELSLLRRNRSGETVFVASWYQVNDVVTASAYKLKLIEVLEKLRRNHQLSSRGYVAISLGDKSEEEGKRVLTQFVRDRGADLVRLLASTGSG